MHNSSPLNARKMPSYAKSLFLATLLFLTPTLVLSTESAKPADAMPPDVLARQITDEVFEIVRQDEAIKDGDYKKAAALVEKLVLPHFNFRRMTMLAVGKSWRRATSEQRSALINEFRSLLIRTYASALTELSSEQEIKYKPLRMQPGDTDVNVKAEFRQSAGAPPVQLEYAMRNSGEGWKAFDVLVDGVSMVLNYRQTFTQEIKKSGIDGLIKTLGRKDREESAAKSKETSEEKTE